MSAPSTRQCLELLGAKFGISNGDRRSEMLAEVTGTSDITPAILDTLASICVAKKDDVIAVSADILNDKIVLRVAGNRGVSSKVEKHLLEVWRLLQRFKVTPRKDNPLDASETSSEMKLCEHLYGFSINKVCKRVKKHGDDTLQALRLWGDKKVNLRWEEFDDTLYTLGLVNDTLEDNSDTLGPDIEAICGLLESIYERTLSTINEINRTDPAALAESPWRGLRKILSLHKDAKLLSRIPRSPVRRKYLSKELQVICMDKHHISTPLEMPASAEELYNYFFPTTAEAPDDRTQVIDALTVWRKDGFPGDVTDVTTIVHAECIMVLEVRRQLPFTSGVYIGVSKLSCLSCHHFIKVFNSAAFDGGHGFQTKGTHGKVYPRWGDPFALQWTEADERSKPDVQRRFGEALEETLKQALTVAGHSRTNSDSTAATEESDKDALQDRRVLRKYQTELEQKRARKKALLKGKVDNS